MSRHKNDGFFIYIWCMVSASELRIGNYYIDICGVINKWELSFYEHYQNLGDDGFPKIKPIPLTPEILGKCGFKKDDFRIWEIKDDYSKPFDIDDVLEFSESKGIFTPTTNGGEYSIGKSFKFVHQLQNLIFALTGRELELNL